MRTGAVAALVGAALAAPGGAARAEPPRVDLRLEAGSEFDTNIHRLEQGEGEEVDLEAAPLFRLGLRGRVAWRRAADRLRLDARAHGKLFASEGGQSENVGVVAADGGYERRLGERAASAILHGSYYDAIGFELYPPDRLYQSRNFRSALGEGQLALAGPGGHRATAGAGYRLFRYKADPLFDWDGPTLGLGWQTTIWRGDPDVDPEAGSIELSAAYRVERRGYDSTARTRACPGDDATDADCFAGTPIARADLHHGLAVEAVWTGARVYTARYELEVNDSNSLGESLVRQRLELGATVELGADVYLTGEAAVLYNVFLDSLLVARDVQSQTFVSIDDENRNSLTALLAWRLRRDTTAEARYAIYTNEFATDELAFRRQTFYLGVVHDL